MKTSLYDRLENATTEQLIRIRDMFSRIIERRERTPRFDYHGRCVLRCTLILERRGVLKSPTDRDGSSTSKGLSE
jgi:hypothetical protein